MKVTVIPGKVHSGAIKQVVESIQEFGIKYNLVTNSPLIRFEGSDIAIIIGSDKDLLDVFHHIEKLNIPVLGVGEPKDGFLTEVDINNFKDSLRQIMRGDYSLEEAFRLNVKIDGNDVPSAVNEAALFASRSATLVEYVLNVDGEVVWRDYSDGIIISTPIGSTAYSMSAGGPIILRNSKIFAVVSVNSLDITRRPLIVSDDSPIKIDDISSVRGCDLVVDGIYRSKVKERLEVFKSPDPIKLIRLPKTSNTMNQIVKKVKVAEDLLHMPPSAKLVLKTLEYEGPLTQKDIVNKTMLPGRTARMGLTILVEKGLVARKPFLRDVRQSVYYSI